MKVQKKKYERIDAVSKIIGLILLAIGVDNASKGNIFTALTFFIFGGVVSIIPLFIEVEI